MGHEAGDAYIRRFAVALRAAMPEEHFVGRAGGDEFLAITHGPDADALQKLLSHVRKQLAEESRQHPDTPLSYAAALRLHRIQSGHAICAICLTLRTKTCTQQKPRQARGSRRRKAAGFSAAEAGQPPAPQLFRLPVLRCASGHLPHHPRVRELFSGIGRQLHRRRRADCRGTGC